MFRRSRFHLPLRRDPMGRDMTSKVSLGSPASGFLGPLRIAALLALLAGAVGSVGLMLHAGRHNDSRSCSYSSHSGCSPVRGPHIGQRGFEALAGSYRVALYTVMLVLTLGSLAAYGDVALGPPRAKTAAVFVVVPRRHGC